MLVAIKVGNSTAQIAFFQDPKIDNFSLILESPKEKINWKELKSILSPFREAECIICSVVPQLSENFIRNYESFFKNILLINHTLITGLNIKVKNPEKFGADRLTCSVAAYEKYKKNLAIVDAGTATTITILSNKGEILGGTIMPGLKIMSECLKEKTAQLPIVEINSPESILGTDTLSSIKSGIVWGTVFAVEGIVKKIEEYLQQKLSIVLTGGNAHLLSKYLSYPHFLNPYLVIEGMRLIYLKNIKKLGGNYEV